MDKQTDRHHQPDKAHAMQPTWIPQRPEAFIVIRILHKLLEISVVVEVGDI